MRKYPDPPADLEGDELDQWKRYNLPQPGIAVGDDVRLGSWAGPCLDRYVLSIGKTRYKLGNRYGFELADGSRYTPEPSYAYFFEVHKEPCTRCLDHPKTEYPNGWMG